MFKNIFRLTVLSRQLDEPRRLIHGRLQPFRSALSRHDTSLLVWLLLCLSRSESHGLPRRRRMTKKLESPIRCGQRGVIITCNSAFAGLQQVTYRLVNCALPLMPWSSIGFSQRERS